MTSIMTSIIPWIVFSILAWVIASNKGRSGIGFFLLSLLLSPLVGIIAALVVKPNVKNQEDLKITAGTDRKCPKCAELVKKEAKICRFCNHIFTNESNQLPLEEYVCLKEGHVTTEFGDGKCHRKENNKPECEGRLSKKGWDR